MAEPKEHKYKRFVIFGFNRYCGCYPCGGIDDVVGEADTFAEAKTLVSKGKGRFYDFCQVLDLQERVECEIEEP